MTIVRFLSAVSAFMIVRSEQWSFEIKNESRTAGWWKAERFWCPDFDDDMPPTPYFIKRLKLVDCNNWRTCADGFAGNGDLLAYLMYAGIAVSVNYS